MWHVSQLSFTECHLTCVTEADLIFLSWSLFLILESCKDIKVEDYVSIECFQVNSMCILE